MQIEDLFIQNKEAEVCEIKAYKIESKSNCACYRFCGATIDARNHIIGIPNMGTKVLDIDPATDQIEQWGDLPVCDKKMWTGGGLASNGMVYAFTREANEYLVIDSLRRLVFYEALHKEYVGAHHYGGAVIDKNMIVQPPLKDKNNIILYRTDNQETESKKIPVKIVQKNTKYYGAVYDGEHTVFFPPTGSRCRLMKLSIPDCKVSYIGRMLENVRFYGGVLTPYGIFSFSPTGDEILKIGRSGNDIKRIRLKNVAGCYGAKLAFNGKIYTIPGSADSIIEFDPATEQVTHRFLLPIEQKGVKAKCAGGAVDCFGNIWCMPAMGEYVYKICFEGIRAYPDKELYQSPYFATTY